MLPTFVSVRLNSPQKTQFIIIHVIVLIPTSVLIVMWLAIFKAPF